MAHENKTEKGATIAGAISIHDAIIWLPIHHVDLNRKRSLPSFLRDLPSNQSNSPPRKRRQLDAREREEYFMGCCSRQDFNEPKPATTAAAERAQASQAKGMN